MKVSEVVDRAVRDPVFASALFLKADAASRELGPGARGQVGGEAYTELLREFAESPAELARLTSPSAIVDEGVTTTTTITTLTTTTTVTTLACTVTTTTTTTGTTTLTHVVEE
jgi:hypothetical protein